MGRNIKTIYEYFSDYKVEEIDEIIRNLPIEEKIIISDRYGSDLHNPKTSENWTRESSNIFYKKIIPKIKKLLSKGIEVTEMPKLEVIGQTEKLLQLLKDERSNKEICEKLGINSQQLYNELLTLKNKGISHSRTYYSDGTIKYKNAWRISDLKKCYKSRSNKTIITDSSENNMKILLISDLHFGNELERIDLINRAFNYCIKNSINTILCGGDLIDGDFTKGTQRISDLYQQVEFFINNYPSDKNILTFSVAGDHDLSAFEHASLDIIQVCNNFRHDIVIGEYNNTIINLKNDKIHLYHHVSKGSLCYYVKAPIILHGHLHRYKTEIFNNVLNITIPTLSNLVQAMPSVLELNLSFNKGYIDNALIKHIYLGKQDIILSESTFDLLKDRTVDDGPIKNIENYKDESIDYSNVDKTLNKSLQTVSQIEKFNRRYGIK